MPHTIPHTYHFIITDTLTGIKHHITYANTPLTPPQFSFYLHEGGLSCDCTRAQLLNLRHIPCGNTRFITDDLPLSPAIRPA